MAAHEAARSKRANKPNDQDPVWKIRYTTDRVNGIAWGKAGRGCEGCKCCSLWRACDATHAHGLKVTRTPWANMRLNKPICVGHIVSPMDTSCFHCCAAVCFGVFRIQKTACSCSFSAPMQRTTKQTSKLWQPQEGCKVKRTTDTIRWIQRQLLSDQQPNTQIAHRCPPMPTVLVDTNDHCVFGGQRA